MAHRWSGVANSENLLTSKIDITFVKHIQYQNHITHTDRGWIVLGELKGARAVGQLPGNFEKPSKKKKSRFLRVAQHDVMEIVKSVY